MADVRIVCVVEHQDEQDEWDAVIAFTDRKSADRFCINLGNARVHELLLIDGELGDPHATQTGNIQGAAANPDEVPRLD